MKRLAKINGEELFQLAVEASPNAMILIDSSFRIVLVNAQAEAVFGYSREELLGKELEILLPPRFRPAHPEQMHAFFAAPKARSMGVGRELYGLHKEGREIPIEIGLNPIMTEEGSFVLASIMDITSRRQVEQSLQHLAAIIESSDDAIISEDLDGRILSWNRGAEQIFGYSADEIVGRFMMVLVPPDRLDEETQNISALRRGERVHHFETDRVRKDGQKITISATISPIYGASGQIIGASNVARDISEMRRSQKLVQLINDRQTAILNNSLDAIITIDHQGRVVDFNPAAEELFGYLRDDVLHKNMGELIVPPSYREAHARGIKHYLATGEGPVIGKRIEINAMRADGSEIPIELAIMAIKSDKMPLFTACVRDLTERKQSEAALNERVRLLALSSEIGLALSRSGSLMSTLQDCAESIVRQLDMALTRIWKVNEAGDTLELQASAGMNIGLDGMQESVPVGKFEIGLIAQDRKPLITNDILGDSRISDQEWARREGMLAFAGHPLVVDDKLMGVVAMFARHPISEAMVAVIGSAADAIASGISRKNTEEALILSELRAKSANRAKSDFLAHMSHEIRTPMNGVLGMTRLMLSTDLNPLQREYQEMSLRSAESLLTIIDDILDFSKIEANKLTLVSEVFPLARCIENAVSDCAMSAHAKNLELICDLDPMVPESVVGDAGRLRQVLLNLISNAIKFTEHGEVTLSVRTVTVSDEEVCLNFFVKDTGVGIPDERLARIFEAFEQADSSISRTYGGTGLGLSISARLVEMMGGVLEADSEFGAGSTFHFHARFGPTDLATQTQIESSRALPALQGMRILVVDDNATNRKILFDQLTHWNMKPHCVETGREAIQAFRDACSEGDPFSLILIDSVMPEMDGFELARTLQDHVDTHTPDGAAIMMLASTNQQQDIALCRSLGIDSCLSKPIKVSALLKSLLKLRGITCGEQYSDAVPTYRSIQRHDQHTASHPSASGETTRLRILLAEDNLINQKVATAVLKELGHEVTVVKNGLEVLATLEDQQFDLVLMDVQMPIMDGIQATAAIREKEKTSGRHLPIIALTAHALKEDAERCLEAGMDEHASKPVDPAELERVIRKCIPFPGTSSPSRVCELPADSNVFDPVVLLERVGGDSGLRDEVLDLAITEILCFMEEMQGAVLEKDFSQIKAIAHTCKGTLLNLAARNAAAVALRLEQAGLAENLSEVNEQFDHLKEQARCLSLAIETFRSHPAKRGT